MMTIQEALDQFLAEVGEGNRRSMHSPWSIIELLRVFLNDYGYDGLSEPDRTEFEREYDQGRQFREIFRFDRVEPALLNRFLSTFVIKNVAGTNSFYKACGPLIEKLVAWLGKKNYWSHEQMNSFRELVGPKAGSELGACASLGSLLQEYSDAHSAAVPRDLNILPDEDYLEERFTITKVTPARLHFESFDEGEIVLSLSNHITGKARIGWSVFLELARVTDKWQIVSVGNVYPS